MCQFVRTSVRLFGRDARTRATAVLAGASQLVDRLGKTNQLRDLSEFLLERLAGEFPAHQIGHSFGEVKLCRFRMAFKRS